MLSDRALPPIPHVDADRYGGLLDGGFRTTFLCTAFRVTPGSSCATVVVISNGATKGNISIVQYGINSP